jgi:hypothetical protein
MISRERLRGLGKKDTETGKRKTEITPEDSKRVNRRLGALKEVLHMPWRCK